ncbi:hypothetical protein [Motilibacter deserti]|uniref:Uncharacterized protein n=1 Tax=Motilibacter deserti TaxID=2714956 RepID=A0ABX0GSQ1_9ACTN|nr:hypothetical protein [Motilibacter deserti]NHC13807.1 hypothetical protein [Motilibacter deserti]
MLVLRHALDAAPSGQAYTSPQTSGTPGVATTSGAGVWSTAPSPAGHPAGPTGAAAPTAVGPLGTFAGVQSAGRPAPLPVQPRSAGRLTPLTDHPWDVVPPAALPVQAHDSRLPLPLASPAPRTAAASESGTSTGPDTGTTTAYAMAPVAGAGSAVLATGVAQRAADGSLEFPAAQPPASTATGSTVTDPPSAAPPAGGGDTGDLDELARKLYDRIRWRLRTELRLDLERAGRGAGLLR